MGAKIKTVLKDFTYMYCDDFAKYLSDMAAKGWHFKEWGIGLKFEKGEPEKSVYAVEVFQKAGEDDMEPGPNTQEFAEYCESAGWKFVGARKKFCIFKKIDENAPDLFTPEERVVNAFKGTVSRLALLSFFLEGFMAFLQWEKLLSSFVTVIFSGGFLLGFGIWNALFIGQLLEFVQVFWKRSRLMKGIRFGQKVYLRNRKNGKFRPGLNDVYISILVLVLMYYFFAMGRMEFIVINVIIVGVAFGFAALLNKIHPEHDANVIIQIGFTVVALFSIITFAVISFFGDGVDWEMKKDNLPMQIADYRETQNEIQDISYYYEGNMFGNVDKYIVSGDKESIYYYVYKSEYSAILDEVWEDIVSNIKNNKNVVDCTEDWNAKKAVRTGIGIYYVRYNNAILEFYDDQDVYLSKEQIDIILDKLEIR